MTGSCTWRPGAYFSGFVFSYAIFRNLLLPAWSSFLPSTSIARQLDYRSEIVLWESSVALAPWNARAHNNLGYAYQLAGRTDDARREYHSALLFDPHHQKTRFNLMFLK